ncbi:penicillin-binding protein 2 [Sphingomonadales bacterium 56]|uniref:penicillin-binding protein 2 n=1 Tax=unclassified Sphingobium TaxID=2611147 RepID=UPI00191A969D|nr:MULTISPECIES: penicillin-binding protein 2 [unclassified Sphingobium]MBY2927896.1 penicillin-binding protein 2 [Sphingomonadales bacterium 56]MBY2957996.1 penicillin-binding protein 2 [Sphingomonadales bacterium 58]CAD7336160.1 Peptidoglycan D,D-transpeptidase MrdA [Sphingobium sp. S6]CAD7336223.1 Peptidoglycan D,D-transpeptidase MrdA [Sphingobium sp. S8]
MKLPRLKRKTVTEASLSFTFTRRAMVVGGLQAGIGAMLIGRMAWISVAENEKYNLLSESNRVNLTLIPPRRGWILDRNGRALANNRTDFRVDLIPERVTDPEGTLRSLAHLLALAPDEVERIRTELDKAPGFRPVQVAEKLTYDQFAAVSVRLPDLPGVAPSQGFSRYYPTGSTVGHLLGYVGAASAKDYEKRKDPLLITPGFKVGKEGLEKWFDLELTGKPGAKRVEVTARGKIVRELTTRPDAPGNAVKLTIDAGLQDYAGRRLGAESGSCIVLDCLTGEILCMASMPSYDPNNFSDGISHDEWDMLSSDERHPLINKSLNALYPPGSTFKPMVAMALQSAGIDPKERVHCPGGYRLGNRFFRCLGRHGSVDMHRALAKSCNTYFYTMGNRVGIDVIARMGHAMGFGEKFDLPVSSQSYGTMPDTAWKMRRYDQKWTASDTLNASIGQGYVVVNPLQLAVMAGRIASGRNIQPRLVKGRYPEAPFMPFPKEHFDAVRGGMWEVVNGDGTAGRSRLDLPGIQMGGKTGTAQVRKIAGSQRGQSGAWKYRDHGLFVCFAPTSNPRYAASVVIEHGMGGSRAAAPVAKDVLTYLFDPAKAMARLEELEKGWGGPPAERMERQMAAYRLAKAIKKGEVVPKPADPSEAENSANAAASANVSETADNRPPQRDPNREADR